MNQRLTRGAIGLVIAAALGTGLTGCFGFGNPVESVVEGVLEQAGGGGAVDIETGGKLPEEFPSADIPLIDGDIQGGGRLRTADGDSWTVTLRVPSGADAAAKDAESKLTSAGFEAMLSSSSTSGAGGGFYQKAPYTVLVGVTSEGSATVINYTVVKSTR